MVEGQLPSIMTLDPGGTTGWSWFNPEDNVVLCGQISGSHHEELYRFLSTRFGSNTHFFHADGKQIVYESFQFRQFRGFDKSKVELDSVEYIGVIKLYSQMTGIPLHPQTASLAKNFVHDEKLRLLGWYKLTSGLVHARDALRHLLYYLCVIKHVKEPIIDKWITKRVVGT